MSDSITAAVANEIGGLRMFLLTLNDWPGYDATQNQRRIHVKFIRTPSMPNGSSATVIVCRQKP
jgi:hypothetical protein